jgi:hypothetical protein
MKTRVTRAQLDKLSYKPKIGSLFYAYLSGNYNNGYKNEYYWPRVERRGGSHSIIAPAGQELGFWRGLAGDPLSDPFRKPRGSEGSDHIWSLKCLGLNHSCRSGGIKLIYRKSRGSLECCCGGGGSVICEIVLADGQGTSNMLTRTELDKLVPGPRESLRVWGIKDLKSGLKSWPGIPCGTGTLRADPDFRLLSECPGIALLSGSRRCHGDCAEHGDRGVTYNQLTGALTWTCCESFSVSFEVATRDLGVKDDVVKARTPLKPPVIDQATAGAAAAAMRNLKWELYSGYDGRRLK